MVTLRVGTAANEHPVTSLPQNQFTAALRTRHTQFFNNVPIILVQRTEVITSRVMRAAKKGAMFSMAQLQFSTTDRARLVLQCMFMGGKQFVVDFVTHSKAKNSVQNTLLFGVQQLFH